MIFFITQDIKNMIIFAYMLCENLQWIAIFQISFYEIKIEYTLYEKHLFE